MGLDNMHCATGLWLAWMLVCLGTACAAPVRSGDLMLAGGGPGEAHVVQVRRPPGSMYYFGNNW